MNERINRLNNLMVKAKTPHFFTDTVGLSDEENKKAWEMIHKTETDALNVNTSTTHDIKILSEYFSKVIDGSKTFEIRKNDRNYKVGDRLLMREYINNGDYETGGWIFATITYITNYNQKNDYVVMSIKVYSYQEGFMYID